MLSDSQLSPTSEKDSAEDVWNLELLVIYVIYSSKQHVRLVHLEMSHFGEKIEPPCHVFPDVIGETFIGMIFRITSGLVYRTCWIYNAGGFTKRFMIAPHQPD